MKLVKKLSIIFATLSLIASRSCLAIPTDPDLPGADDARDDFNADPSCQQPAAERASSSTFESPREPPLSRSKFRKSPLDSSSSYPSLGAARVSSQDDSQDLDVHSASLSSSIQQHIGENQLPFSRSLVQGEAEESGNNSPVKRVHFPSDDQLATFSYPDGTNYGSQQQISKFSASGHLLTQKYLHQYDAQVRKNSRQRWLEERSKHYLGRVFYHTGLESGERTEVRLVEAYKNGESIDLIRLLINCLAEGVKLPSGQSQLENAFIGASSQGLPTLISLLREHAFENKIGSELLSEATYKAAFNGQVEVVRMLLGWGGLAVKALAGAIMGDQANVILFALASDPDVIQNERLLGDSLITAACRGKVRILEALLFVGFFTRSTIVTALQSAHRYKWPAAASMLLDFLQKY